MTNYNCMTLTSLRGGIHEVIDTCLTYQSFSVVESLVIHVIEVTNVFAGVQCQNLDCLNFRSSTMPVLANFVLHSKERRFVIQVDCNYGLTYNIIIVDTQLLH